MKLDGMSMDLEKTNMEKLRSVFPECFSEQKLDIDKLLSLCGEYIDNDFEKYKFEWKGKIEALKLAQKRSTGTLRPCKAESVNFDETKNLYIEGDNLEVLKLLQTAYYNKIKMIYIDPPYNTGNDFVYEDDFADPMARYKEVTQQTTKSNAETMGRYHTNWLNMMYPRLRLAVNLLTDDGVIFISIDDNEVHNLRKACDEVFGEENFISQIVWERSYAPINMVKHFSKSHDYILCYAKNIDYAVCNGLERPESTNSKYGNPDNDPRGLWRTDNLSVGPVVEEKVYEIVTPSGRVCLPPKGRCWLYTKERYEEMVADNRIWFGENGDNVPAPKRFLSEVKQGLTPMTIWKYTDVGHTQDSMRELRALFDGEKVFDYSKPVKLMKQIVQLYTNEDDIVLDFFSGSASTAHAVMSLNLDDGKNRRFIMVQLPELTEEKSEAFKAGYKNICEIGKERIRRAGKKILEDNAQTELGEEDKKPLDVGFKVFKLDDSNLKIWDGTPIQDKQIDLFYERLNAMIDTVKDDRTDMDVVYEVMLKMGIPLTETVTQISLAECRNENVECRNDENSASYTIHSTLQKVAYAVGDFLLLVCLAEKITAEDIEAMAQYAPAKIICAEAGFADDSALSNAHYILKDRAIELKLV